MVNTGTVSRNDSNYAENLFGVYLYTLVNKHIRLMAGKFYTVLEDDDIDDLVHDAWFKVIEACITERLKHLMKCCRIKALESAHLNSSQPR